MKKHLMIPFIAALFAITLLASCGSNSDNAANNNLQEPAAAQQAQSETGAGQTAITKTENGENEENEVVEKGSNQPAAGTTAASTNAKTTITNNMITAFTGETTASAKYAAYAKKAQEEGYPQIALLFKAASTAENIHANNHKAVLEDMEVSIPVVKPQFTVKSTQENLQDAITGESYEVSTMYPEFLTNAKSAGNQLALISLNYAYKTEQKHKTMYENALNALQNNQVKTLAGQYYVCPTCGNTYETTAPKRCGISMTGSERFIKITNA